MKSTPVCSAISRTASWTGFPTVIPHVAWGWPMRRASWRASTVSSPARPGAASFGPAAEAGEEVGLDEAGGDAHVGVEPQVVQPHRHVAGEPAEPAEAGVVAGVVVDHPDGGEHVTTEHVLQLGRGVAPMGAGGDEHDDAIEPDHGLQHVEQRRDHQVPRLGPGAVAHRDGDGLPGSDALVQRRADVGGPQRPGQRGPLVGHGLELAGPDDGGGSVGDVDGHPRLAVGEVDPHAGRLAGSMAARWRSRYTSVAVPPRTASRSEGESPSSSSSAARDDGAVGRGQRAHRPVGAEQRPSRTEAGQRRARRRAGGRRPTSSASRPRSPGPRACTDTFGMTGQPGELGGPRLGHARGDGRLGGVVEHEPTLGHQGGHGRRGREVLRPDQQVVGEAACGHRAQAARRTSAPEQPLGVGLVLDEAPEAHQVRAADRGAQPVELLARRRLRSGRRSPRPR